MWKVSPDFEIVDPRVRHQQIFEGRPQVGNIPLAVTDLVDETAFRIRRSDQKRLVKSIIRSNDPQTRVQNHNGLPSRLNQGCVVDAGLIQRAL